MSLKITSPKPDEVIPIPPADAGQPAATGAPVEVKLELTGYETFQDPATKHGQYVALMLDNFPTVFAYFDIGEAVALQEDSEGHAHAPGLPGAAVGRVHQGGLRVRRR